MKYLLALLLVGCGSMNYTGLESKELKNFKLLAQPDHITCGPTSATMILNWYGKNVTIGEVKEKSLTRWFTWEGEDIGMTFPSALEMSMNNLGVKMRLEVGNIDSLTASIDKNKPVILLIRSGKALWHYVVVIGYNSEGAVIADPGGGVKYTMNWNRLKACWGFDKDMWGEEVLSDCKLCKGSGKMCGIPILCICDVCGGSGKGPDIARKLVESVAKPYTMLRVD